MIVEICYTKGGDYMILSAGIEVIKKLKENGFEAFIVGGFVRDYILEIASSDIDITTNAKPEEVMKIFNTKPTGVKFGTVLVLYKGFHFEVTTYRIDEDYQDNRHPKKVSFSSNILDDLKRRDFTINSLIMDDNKQIINYCEGLEDLEVKRLRAIGNPKLRFKEDALRILRAFSFVSKLGFDIEENTFNALLEQKDNLIYISNERIQQELVKIFKGQYKQKALQLLCSNHILDFYPELKVAYEEIKDLDLDAFYVKCFKENGEIPCYWRFSKQKVRLYVSTINVLKMKIFLDKKAIFDFGYETIALANKITHEIDIDEVYKTMDIHDLKDLCVDGTYFLKKGYKNEEIKDIMKKISHMILDGLINNDIRSIDYFLKG